MTSKVVMYTDGACRGNPGPGGWGVILSYRDRNKKLSGFDPQTTNNRMELTAAIEGLRALSRACDIELNTDSKYVLQGISEWIESWKSNGWKTAAKKPVKNVDLWQSLDEQVKKHRINWHWVKGHAGIEGNEMADQLANLAIDLAMEKS
ncbi:MAG: ribonuclease HI [Gammaproteobacteria bacterium]